MLIGHTQSKIQTSCFHFLLGSLVFVSFNNCTLRTWGSLNVTDNQGNSGLNKKKNTHQNCSYIICFHCRNSILSLRSNTVWRLRKPFTHLTVTFNMNLETHSYTAWASVCHVNYQPGYSLPRHREWLKSVRLAPKRHFIQHKQGASQQRFPAQWKTHCDL